VWKKGPILSEGVPELSRILAATSAALFAFYQISLQLAHCLQPPLLDLSVFAHYPSNRPNPSSLVRHGSASGERSRYLPVQFANIVT